ncbi:MAG: NAD(P)-dependent oxidoreductase [Nocardioidaceae bacterium]
MRIALYGGTGMIGSRIAGEAVTRDHRVTTISRHPWATATLGIRTRLGDASDGNDVARVSAEHDVVVSAIGPSRTGGRHLTFLHALASLAENVGSRRLVVVGGSGSLLVAPGLRLLDSPAFPSAHREEASTHAAALELLKDTGGMADWVYVSPAPAISPGERTGSYRVGRDQVIGDWISAEDFAVAIVDEIEVPRHRRARFCVAH